MDPEDCFETLNCMPLLTDLQKQEILQSNGTERDCLFDEWLNVYDYMNGSTLCPPYWDNYICWPATPSQVTAKHLCPEEIEGFTNGSATRYCDISGNWFHKADYHACLSEEMLQLVQDRLREPTVLPQDVIEDPLNEWRAFLVRDIYFYGSITSLALLFVALLIFSLFKSLQCPRVHIHKNLLVSLMLQCVLTVIIFEPYFTTNENDAYVDHAWLCKLLFTLSNYVTMTNIFWAFVEGLFLYSRISIAVFSTDTPYWLFYLIGWGIPALFVTIWAVCMHFIHQDQVCWRRFGSLPQFWIITAPISAAVAANIFFLVCIIRILVTKLNAVHSGEQAQIRKAMKATVVLLPLLSITSIFFLSTPDAQSSPTVYTAYRITNACLQVSQGMFVSVLFCFFNGEVRTALVKHWKKCRFEVFRYRTSRASSVCVTQSEAYEERYWWFPTISIKRSYDRRNVYHLMALGTPLRRSSHSSASAAVIV